MWRACLNKWGCLVIASVATLGGVSDLADAQTSTLSAVKQRGALNCGVNAGLPGFSQSDDNGNWTGFDADYCRAIAAAIFGDAGKVKFVPTTAKERFTTLRSGRIDVLVRNTTWSIARESSLGLVFAGVNYYDGEGFMAKASRGARSIKELDGASICVVGGTTTELNLAEHFKLNSLTYRPLVLETSEGAVQAYLAGRCDVYTADQSALYAARTQFPRPKDHLVLPELISKEPLGPAVRKGDEQWLLIVKWVHFALINAEELGITQDNVAHMASSPHPEIKRFLGLDADFGKGLGLDADFASKAVKAVGNYGEVFERNVGSHSRLNIARGLNNLWRNGGIQYAPPFR
jgi:general L-amino acid transport system substrate-binding protein